MSLAVAGLWELGWSAPITEAELWIHPMRDFGVSHWHMAPVSGVVVQFSLQEWKRPDVMFEALRNRHTLVFVSENAETELADFEHPENACYCFGKANYSPFMNMMTDDDLSVRIATKENRARLWPHQAMVAVLWHRGSQWP